MQTTLNTLDRPGIARRWIEVGDRATILAALTALAQQTDPMGQADLLAAVLCALQDGGMRVGMLLDCVADCVAEVEA